VVNEWWEGGRGREDYTRVARGIEDDNNNNERRMREER
jgi:hypothetical protein